MPTRPRGPHTDRHARGPRPARPVPPPQIPRVPALLLVAVLVAVGAAWTLAGPGDEATAGAGTPGLDAVAVEPERFLREVVTVTGEVSERYDDLAFTLAGPAGRDVLVRPTGKELRRSLREDWPSGILEVTGSVRRVGIDLAGVLDQDMPVLDGHAAINATAVGPAADAASER